jgi:hypothetical protein
VVAAQDLPGAGKVAFLGRSSEGCSNLKGHRNHSLGEKLKLLFSHLSGGVLSRRLEINKVDVR